jgi:Icc protein
MHRIAHLSDVHILERRTPRDGSYSLSTRMVSFQRPLDGEARATKLKNALESAKRVLADHVVISGDLTEMGTMPQFERFSEILHDSGIAPERITLVPGNHDAYTAPDGWQKAMSGPLRAFAPSSAAQPGHVVDIGPVALLPVDFTCHQSIARSGGELTESVAALLTKRVEDSALSKKAMVLVQHHPPFGNAKNPWHFIDGLRGYAQLLHLMAKHPKLQILHGHLHRIMDRIAVGNAKNRVFSAPATVDDTVTRPRVRLYEVRDGMLESLGLIAA